MPFRISHAYGYIVCLIAVVTALISLGQLVDSGFEMADPYHGMRGDPSMSSFEFYQASYATGRYGPGPTITVPGAQPEIPDSATLHVMWQAMRDERIASQRFYATRGLVKNALLLLAALALFATHWRWLRRERAGEV